jgi:hypothetical protein
MPNSARKPKPETTRYPTKLQAKKEAKAKRAPLHPLDAMGPIVMREDSPASAGKSRAGALREYRTTQRGKIFLGDSLELLRGRIADSSVDLIMTSPPFGLVCKKDYSNVDAHNYVEWFKQFGREFHRVLKDTGSLVIDIGGAWISGQPLAA